MITKGKHIHLISPKQHLIINKNKIISVVLEGYKFFWDYPIVAKINYAKHWSEPVMLLGNNNIMIPITNEGDAIEYTFDITSRHMADVCQQNFEKMNIRVINRLD